MQRNFSRWKGSYVYQSLLLPEIVSDLLQPVVTPERGNTMFQITVVFQIRQVLKVGIQTFEFPEDVRMIDVVNVVQDWANKKNAYSWMLSRIVKLEEQSHEF
jgi:hypothetical protein